MLSFKCKRGERHAQATMFIIIAVVIVGAIVMIFLLANAGYIKIPKPPRQTLPAAQEYIGKCAHDAAQDVIDTMLPQGGYFTPTNYRLYNGDKVQYLVYNYQDYYPGTNQEPMYLEHIEREIIEKMTPRVNECFLELKTEYEAMKYNVQPEPLGEMKISLVLKPGKVDIKINRFFQVNRDLESIKVEEFETFVISGVYDLARAAVEIINQEFEYCNFETGGFTLLSNLYSRHNLVVSKYEFADGARIYTIVDKNTNEVLNIAVRSCILPPGA